MEKDDYRKEIGKRIAEARARKGWTLAQLASHSGVGSSTLSNYEQGIRMPGPYEIKQIAKATGEGAAYLMCLDDASVAPVDGGVSWLDPKVENLPQVFKDALRLKAERYLEVVAKLPVAVVMMFRAPTSDSYEAWERGVEASYRSITSGGNQAEEAELDQVLVNEILDNLRKASLDGRQVVLRNSRAAAEAGVRARRIKTGS